MTLDHWLVARLAKDLDALLKGSRIQGLRAQASGILFFCYRRGASLALHISVDSQAPLVAAYALPDATKESGTPGWVSSAAALLRGATVDAVHAVPNDRVLYVEISSRSAFGVPSRSRIVAELQPRKANALVLRQTESDDFLIVAAAKQFSAAGDARNVRTGKLYVPPPARRARLDRAQFIIAASEIALEDVAGLARLLGDFDPECTPALAREVIYRARMDGARLSARALIDGWIKLRSEVETALEELRPPFVLYKDGKIEACHLVPLTSAVDNVAGATSVASGASQTTLNDVCAAELLRRPEPHGGPSAEALRKKLTTMLARGAEEIARLSTARKQAQDAAQLREAGDAIYAQLTEIAPGAVHLTTPGGWEVTLDPLLTPKENAADYFRRYKKAHSGLPRIDERVRVLQANREYWEQLLWGLEHALQLEPSERAALLAEVATAVGTRRQRIKQPRERTQERRVLLSGGAVALVGRSPKENERLTFTVAGPNDYWFHARGIPGAHVIVKTGGPGISPSQVEEAAAIAAANSRASRAAKVEVDYVQRKHVRRHSSRLPGLVWYTDYSTVRVAPRRNTG